MTAAPSPKPRTNPFFFLLMTVSVLFVITSLGYLVGPFIEQQAIDRVGAGPSPGSRALAAWFERKGVFALAIEFLAMLIMGVLAMATDHRFVPPKKP